jgi:hypothetical protein
VQVAGLSSQLPPVKIQKSRCEVLDGQDG